MNITKFSREAITLKLEKARSKKQISETVRIIFSPRLIDDKNIDEVSSVYSQLGINDYDNVVIVETHTGEAEKKLPMPSFKSFKTPLGEVEVNDRLRNDFADEDDDFFVNDDAFDEDVSLHNQLMMLQCCLHDFKVLSIQITDERSFFVKELAFALEEILAAKKALIVFCCDLEQSKIDELKKVKDMVEKDNEIELMNYLNGGGSSVIGAGAFITGLLVAKKWGLRLWFDALNNGDSGQGSLLTGFADKQRQTMAMFE